MTHTTPELRVDGPPAAPATLVLAHGAGAGMDTDFMEWFAVRDLGPQIGQLKAALSQISQKELDRFFVGARANASCRNVLNPMVNRVVNKILFCFIKYINTTAKEKGIAEAKNVVKQIVTQAGQITAEDRQ